MIAILDLGSGNIGSLVNALNWIGVENTIVNSPLTLTKASKIILPGVGSFDTAMEKIHYKGFREPLEELVIHKKTPIMGICLGMQILTESSEEGKLKGLGWIKGKTVKLITSERFKVPNMGWLKVDNKPQTCLSKNIPNNTYFYFAHSYKIEIDEPNDSIMTSHLQQAFISGVQKDNIYGIQFHPEKSHEQGLQLLQNFAEL